MTSRFGHLCLWIMAVEIIILNQGACDVLMMKVQGHPIPCTYRLPATCEP